MEGLSVNYTQLVAVCDFNTLHLRNVSAQLVYYEKTGLTLDYLQTFWAYEMNNREMKSHACHGGENIALELSSGQAYGGTEAQIVKGNQWLLKLNPS